MKRSVFLQTLIILLMILSVSVSPAAAQYEPQAGSVDEDGDLVVEVLPQTSAGSTGIADIDMTLFDRLPGADIAADALVGVEAMPLSPVGLSYVLDKTPTFTFSRDVSATKYQIEVYNVFSTLLVYKEKGAGNCTLTQCSLTPTTRLKNFDIDSHKGLYSWRVRSFDGVSWSNFSSISSFFVMSTGFNSSFDVNAKKWISVNGDWSRTDAGYLKSTGFNNSFASAIQKEYFVDKYVYTVRMKAKGGVDQTQGVIIGGYPTPTFGQNYWNDGVYFLYKNDTASVLIIRDGAVFFWSSWVTQSALNPTGWNELEVTVNAPNASFKINGGAGILVLNFPDDIESGYVGLAHFRSTAVKNPLLVDWAKLSYLPNPTADGMEPENGAMVIDFNDLTEYPSQSGSPFDPPQ